MSAFDSRARSWDSNPVHWERSEAIAKTILEMVPVNPGMKALEYGAGTGILSFLLSDKFSEITLMDNSGEMVKVMHEKVAASGLENLKPVLFNLETSDYQENKFDCIYSQMVLHHLPDTDLFSRKCYEMLNPGGYLVVADLFPEDGSFHGAGAQVHLGFDPGSLSNRLKMLKFEIIGHKTCFIIKRQNETEYPVFLLVAKL